MQAAYKVRVFHDAGTVDLFICTDEQDLVALYFNLRDLSLFSHVDKCTVIDLLDGPLRQPRQRNKIDNDQDRHNDAGVSDHGYFRMFYFIHTRILLSGSVDQWSNIRAYPNISEQGLRVSASRGGDPRYVYYTPIISTRQARVLIAI